MIQKCLIILLLCAVLFSKSSAEMCGLVVASNMYNFINFQIGSNLYTSAHDTEDEKAKFKGFSVGPTYIPLFECPKYGLIDRENILNNLFVGIKYRDNIEKQGAFKSRYRGVDAYLYFTPLVGLNLGYGHLRTTGNGVKSSGDYLQAGLGIVPALPFVNFELLFRQSRHKDAHPILNRRSNSVVFNFNLVFFAALFL